MFTNALLQSNHIKQLSLYFKKRKKGERKIDFKDCHEDIKFDEPKAIFSKIEWLPPISLVDTNSIL